LAGFVERLTGFPIGFAVQTVRANQQIGHAAQLRTVGIAMPGIFGA